MPPLDIKQSDPHHPDAVSLIDELSSILAERTGRNGRDSFANIDIESPRSVFVIAFENDCAVGCGALREIDNKTCEIKRMYARIPRRGVGTEILRALEQYAVQFKYGRVCLETGVENQDTVKFYLSHGYKICENFGKYLGRPECICFEKLLRIT
jgi:RimJ/RimL family protein N-acetyltransferase